MQKKALYDITDVCKMLGTTSRTLRFYEEKNAKNKKRKKSLENGNNQFQPPCATISVQYSIKKGINILRRLHFFATAFC